MDSINTTTIIIAVIALLVVGGLLGMVFSRRQRTKNLKERFGTEYDHTVSQIGDHRRAESELEARVEHVKSLEIHPLSAEAAERFTREWQATQAQFVDEPLAAVQKANSLIKEVMNAKGYPVKDFEQRAADISVDYPELVTDYRGLRSIATKSEHEDMTTEDMRQAMVHGRALFENLLQRETAVEEKNHRVPHQ